MFLCAEAGAASATAYSGLSFNADNTMFMKPSGSLALISSIALSNTSSLNGLVSDISLRSKGLIIRFSFNTLLIFLGPLCPVFSVFFFFPNLLSHYSTTVMV